MTGPENAEVAVDVEGETWVLRYPCGAVHALQKALGESGTVVDAVNLIEKLDIANISVFVWAGLLHADRKADVDQVRETVEWSSTTVADWALAIRTAWVFAMEGSMSDPEVEPGKAVAMTRPGKSWRRLWSLLSGSRQRSSGGDTPSPTVEAGSSPQAT